MGRSVGYLNRADFITYLPAPTPVDEQGEELEYDNDNDYLFRDEWDMFVEDITNCLQELFPSLKGAKEWDGNEVRIFLENNLVQFGISEYCGLVSISARKLESDYQSKDITGLAERWTNNAQVKLEAKLIEWGHKVLSKQGTFSNGEGVYMLKS